MGFVGELVVGNGGVVGWLGCPWCWKGEFHTSQCSVLQSCWERVGGREGGRGRDGLEGREGNGSIVSTSYVSTQILSGTEHRNMPKVDHGGGGEKVFSMRLKVWCHEKSRALFC